MAKAKEKKKAACKVCGVVGETLISIKIPGKGKATPAVCEACWRKAMKQMEAGVPSTRKITKVRQKKETVTIEYDESGGEDTVSVVVESKDAPLASFVEALQALAPHAVALCAIPPEWNEDVDVRSLSIRHGDDGIGVVVSCVKKLSSGAVMSFNTPYTPAESDNGPFLTDDALFDIHALMREAEAYLDGKRAQGKLFEGKSE